MRTLVASTLLALLTTAIARLGAEPGATPRFEWAFDGIVQSTARAGNTLYVGGNFGSVIPVSGVLGQLYAVSPATGAVVPSNLPRQSMRSGNFAVLPDGAGGFYLRGGLTIGSGNTSGRVVHLRADGTADPMFKSPPELAAFGTMVRVGPSLVLVGSNSVSGVNRPVVALDAVTGALSSWIPDLKGDGSGNAAVAANGILYVASGVPFGGTRRIAAFDGTTGTKLWEDDLGTTYGVPTPLVLAGGRLITALGALRAYDPLTGVQDASWGAVAPDPAGRITSMATDGSTLYLSGSFVTLDGRPRSRLGAVSVATGALLPWSPQSSGVGDLTISPTGTVFMSGVEQQPPTINGQTRVGGLFEIDATGAVTPFQLQVTTVNAGVAAFANGVLVVTGRPGVAGAVARQGVAAFDLATGDLLPLAVTLQGQGLLSSDPPSVVELVADGPRLHVSGFFNGVNGSPRAGVATVDATTGTLAPAWALPGLVVSHIGPLVGGDLYVTLRPDPQPPAGAPNVLRRLNPATGQLDLSWQPSLPSVNRAIDHRGTLLVQSSVIQNHLVTAEVIHTVDMGTAQARERYRSAERGQMYPDGDTIYLLVRDPSVFYPPFGFGQTLVAFDLATGVNVMRPAVSGRIAQVALADGRLILGGRNVIAGGTERFGAADLNRSGAVSAWDPGVGPYELSNPIDGAPSGGVTFLQAHGDVLAVAGALTPTADRLAVYPLSGATAPSSLRTRALGDQVEFTWDAAARPPAGGYVLEGGFTPGQTAVTLPVGSGTSFTAPAAVIGPAFVRARAQGEADVSNEVVFGCFAPPLPPTALTTAMNGTALTLSWTAPAGPVTNYTLLGGSASGLSDVATLPVATLTSASGTVPGGTFFARVTASSPCGTSGPSGEVFFTIGATDPLPVAPTNLTSSLNGSTLTLSWSAPGGPVTGYVLEAGSAPGLANIGAATVGASTSFVIPGVPMGTYYVRVRAVSGAGSGAASSDVTVTVP